MNQRFAYLKLNPTDFGVVVGEVHPYARIFGVTVVDREVAESRLVANWVSVDWTNSIKARRLKLGRNIFF